MPLKADEGNRVGGEVWDKNEGMETNSITSIVESKT